MLLPCPVCHNTRLKIEKNVFDDKYFIQCCAITVFGKDTEDEAAKHWNSFYCWKELNRVRGKLQQIFDSYVKTRMDYSGSMGNVSADKRREVAVHEILIELGWDIIS